MREVVFVLLFFLGHVTFGQSDQYAEIQQLIEDGEAIAAEKQLRAISAQGNARYHLLFGEILLQKGVLQKALEEFGKAQPLYEKNDPGTTELANCYSQLGVTHWANGNYNESIKYHQKALAIHSSLKNEKGMAASHNDIGLTYSNYETQKSTGIL